MMKPLEGLKVLDLSQLGPGLFCTMILGDFGAEVLKIESPPEGKAASAGLRLSPSSRSREDAAYLALDRNKKSIAINLRSSEGQEVFYQLAKNADVIVEGFRPGVVKRLGVDYQTIRQLNPRIIYCSITGYGQDGPYSDLPGHDINYISLSGVLGLIGERDAPPAIPLNLLGDFAGGSLHAVIGILLAFIARGKTGRGQYVDIAITDGALSLLTRFAADYLQHGKVPVRGESMLNGTYPYYNIYKTKDDKLLSIGCLVPQLWKNLCQLIGREDFIPYYYIFDHLHHKPEDEKWEEISTYLKQLFLTRTRDEWFELLKSKDIAVGKVCSLDEVFNDPQILHRRMLIEVEDPDKGKSKQVGIAIKLPEMPGEVRTCSPLFGEHTNEVMTGLGYSTREINELRQIGAIA